MPDLSSIIVTERKGAVVKVTIETPKCDECRGYMSFEAHLSGNFVPYGHGMKATDVMLFKCSNCSE